MRKYVSIPHCHVERFKQQVVLFCKDYDFAAVYDSCNYSQQVKSEYHYNSFDFLAGIGSNQIVTGRLKDLADFKKSNKDWLLGYLSYDLKNEVETLYSVNRDHLNFPDLLFFQPRYIIRCTNNQWEIGYLSDMDSDNTISHLLSKITEIEIKDDFSPKIRFVARVSKEKYCQSIESILEHIHVGDIYELNYCIEFFAESVKIDPYNTYINLIKESPTPFTSFFKIKGKYVISASPERYLKKQGNKIISQPIKGTIKRGENIREDEFNKMILQSCEKEQSENIMITDLVRNDLSRIAAKGTVSVEELCGIYPFKQVFQMISTITADAKESVGDIDIIKASFPMGSMTGAPKVRAMKLIEKFEDTKRGVYSGAVGYFSPDGDFDFNVVIRSLFYNLINNYLSFMVGSAITSKSNPEQEYNECLLKAKAILNLFD